jgi:hypothetical protein
MLNQDYKLYRAFIILALFTLALLAFVGCVEVEKTRYVDENGNQIEVVLTEDQKIENGQVVEKIADDWKDPIRDRIVSKYGHTFIEHYRRNYGDITGDAAVYSAMHDPNCANPKHPENQAQSTVEEEETNEYGY